MVLTHAVAVLLVSFPSQGSAQDLHLFGGPSNDEFMGSLTSHYDSDSVCNRYGTFGSRYNSESIWNRYGKGSRYDEDSPWNRYGGPALVDDEGNYYGTFSIGANTEIGRALRALHEQAEGDIGELRDLFCDALSGHEAE
jgi:hypothetical protein